MSVTAIFFFKMKAKDIPRQDLVLMNISCKFDSSTCYTFAKGVTEKSMHTAAAAAYPCVIHSIHQMLSSEYNEFYQAIICCEKS